jgi:uncharacterized membrane protein
MAKSRTPHADSYHAVSEIPPQYFVKFSYAADLLEIITMRGTVCIQAMDETRIPSKGLVQATHLVYALHAVSLVLGAFGAASVIGSFLFGWPSIIAVIINYVKRSEARGTWLEPHFKWQIQTFWYALAWACFVGLISLVLMLVLVGFATWVIGFLILGIWAIYRVVRGWLALNEGKPPHPQM